LKYSGCSDAFHEIFFSIPVQAVTALSSLRSMNPLLQPIPLHVQRLRQRGYNQSAVIAEYVSYITQYPGISALERHKYTLPQAKAQSRLHRHYNIRNAFSVPAPETVASKTIVLVDDVITSGNTATEAARILKQSGADQVFVWTLARQ
jgi:ComF family protein